MLRIPVAAAGAVAALAAAVALAPALWPAQPTAADPASTGGPVSTVAGAAMGTETGVKQALAATDTSSRVPAASPAGTPRHPAAPPAVRDILPRAVPDAIAPGGPEPAPPVIPLRPGITRPPLPPAAIVGRVGHEPTRWGRVRARPAVAHPLQPVAAGPAASLVSIVPPAGSGARHVGTVLPAVPAPHAVRGGGARLGALVPLFGVLFLSGALAAWLLWQLLPAPALCRPSAF